MSENETIIEELAKKEKARMLRILAISAVLALCITGAFIYIAKNSDTVFKPNLDIESGEKNVLKDTNDPQCRAIITSAKQIGVEFKAIDPDLSKTLIDGKEGEVRPLLAKVSALKLRLADIKDSVPSATFRDFETKSASGVQNELNAWFKHVDTHFFFLERLANEHLAEIEVKEKTEGTIVVDKESKKTKYKKTPRQRLDGALLAINEAFQSFRVWHTGSLHPCGAASKDETPWAPSK